MLKFQLFSDKIVPMYPIFKGKVYQGKKGNQNNYCILKKGI